MCNLLLSGSKGDHFLTRYFFASFEKHMILPISFHVDDYSRERFLYLPQIVKDPRRQVRLNRRRREQSQALSQIEHYTFCAVPVPIRCGSDEAYRPVYVNRYQRVSVEDARNKSRINSMVTNDTNTHSYGSLKTGSSNDDIARSRADWPRGGQRGARRSCSLS